MTEDYKELVESARALAQRLDARVVWSKQSRSEVKRILLVLLDANGGLTKRLERAERWLAQLCEAAGFGPLEAVASHVATKGRGTVAENADRLLEKRVRAIGKELANPDRALRRQYERADTMERERDEARAALQHSATPEEEKA